MNLSRLPLRASLEDFAQHVERLVRSRMPRHGDEDQWRRRTFTQTFEELVRELDVLSHAIDREGPEDVAYRAAAVGMFALQIYDQAGALARHRGRTDGGEGHKAQGGSSGESGEAGSRAHRREPQDRS